MLRFMVAEQVGMAQEVLHIPISSCYLSFMNRRDFLKTSAVTSGSLLLAQASPAASAAIEPAPARPDPRPRLPNLTPAKWIWYPSERTLANTFILFRRELTLKASPTRATGWICADSRYRLEVNGQRHQWGPAPADPRWPEADPMDLTRALVACRNVLGAVVLYYGHGDGTWPIGKPGFLFWLEIEYGDGTKELVVSDTSWQALIARSWRPGQYKRWYLRSLQEEFDARLYPWGWSTPSFTATQDWLAAMPLPGSPNKPALSAGYPDYALDVGAGPTDTELRPRSIPLLVEVPATGAKLIEAYSFEWLRSPEEYFAFHTPNAFRATPRPRPQGAGDASSPFSQCEFALEANRGVALTFAFPEQFVGWPGVTVQAPAGTTLEMLVHEAHRPGGPPLLNTHFDSWTRFICDGSELRLEPFDFESLRWLQLHFHPGQGQVKISNVAGRRRLFPWAHPPKLRSNEPELQRLFDASLNTLANSAQETLVDGMARERQQYSGDGGHQMHAVHLAMGEPRLVARYLTTWSQGLTKDGYFLDCWPAYDRLARLVERQLDLTVWGPILDHGVGFNFDCWHHYLYTGDLDALREPYPRLLRFARYLQSIVGDDGLLPVENLGIPSVWIDHAAYQQPRHKHCAFNLYAAAALRHALAPLCAAFGDSRQAQAVAVLGQELEAATVRHFWSPSHGLFVNNLPWLAQEKKVRTCDRSLATSILFDQCPNDATAAAVRSLADCPPEMGFSYPCNAGWRLWALARGGRPDILTRDFRARWATMTSVKENNTLQEDWEARHDSGQQWSHCAVVPIYLAFHGLMGLRPLAPGFKRLELRPQLADLTGLELTAHTVLGPIQFTARGPLGKRDLVIELPLGCTGELVVPAAEKVALEPLAEPAASGTRRYRLPVGRPVALHLTLA